MDLDSILFGCGVAMEAALIAGMLRARAHRILPAFFAYICWSLAADLLTYGLRLHSPASYFRAYEIQMMIDSILIFLVLVELAWSVLRPVRASLPRGAWMVIVLLMALAGLLLWPVAGFTIPQLLAPEGRFFFRLQQTFAILRVVVFLAMAGFSQLLSIGWRNRELQVASGLGFFSLTSLVVSVLHSYQIVGVEYHYLDELVSAGYVGVLAFWVLVFATKEAERRNFSPQMEKILLLVGGTARVGRISLADTVVTKAHTREER